MRFACSRADARLAVVRRFAPFPDRRIGSRVVKAEYLRRFLPGLPVLTVVELYGGGVTFAYPLFDSGVEPEFTGQRIFQVEWKTCRFARFHEKIHAVE